MTWWNTFKRTLGLCQPGMHFKKINGLFGQKKNFLFGKLILCEICLQSRKLVFWKLHAHAYFTWIIWTDILTSKLLIILFCIPNYFMLGLGRPTFFIMQITRSGFGSRVLYLVNSAQIDGLLFSLKIRPDLSLHM